jgi:hypothetical protein
MTVSLQMLWCVHISGRGIYAIRQNAAFQSRSKAVKLPLAATRFRRCSQSWIPSNDWIASD